jgi:hypothetical protein
VTSGRLGPYVEGKLAVAGGVVSPAPWKFAGLFSSKLDAENEAAKLGGEYVVRFGDNREGTDDFVWTTLNNPHPGP